MVLDTPDFGDCDRSRSGLLHSVILDDCRLKASFLRALHVDVLKDGYFFIALLFFQFEPLRLCFVELSGIEPESSPGPASGFPGKSMPSSPRRTREIPT